jgi:hypothetical protein
MTNSLPSSKSHDVPQIVSGGRLVEATPEAVRDLAESAMLLSQGARRAIEMMREAGEEVAPETNSVETTADAA